LACPLGAVIPISMGVVPATWNPDAAVVAAKSGAFLFSLAILPQFKEAI